MEVSIIITCYNKEKYISRAIRSCLGQNFPTNEFEVLVVDDASTDRSTEVIKDYGDKIIFIQNKKNLGLPASRNLAIRKASGRYIVHVDGDDYVTKEFIFIEHLHLEHNIHWGGVSCDYFLVDDKEDHLSRISGAMKPIACGVMFRKDAIIDIGLYDESMRAMEDEDFRLRFLSQYHIGHVELPLYRYRRHEQNMTNNELLMKSYTTVLRKRLRKEPLRKKAHYEKQ